jgi:hypothetical protein
VTAVTVVVEMSILSENDAICRALILGMRSLLTKRWKKPIFRRKIPVDKEPFSEKEKRLVTKEISI